MRALRYMCLILCSLLIVVLPQAAHCKQTANFTPSQFIGSPSAENNKLIIFVHGIFGDTLGTWRNSNNKYFWELLKENEPTGLFDKTDIYAYGFESKYFEGSFTINDIASEMYARLNDKGIFGKYKQIIFIAHSMGGLIVMRLLLDHPDISATVPLAFFFSTPQEGAAIANLASVILPNSSLKNMLYSGQNEYLLKSDMEWKNELHDGKISTIINCAFEKKKTGWWPFRARIVNEFSATRACLDKELHPIEADHIDIVKPANGDSTACVYVRNSIRAITQRRLSSLPENALTEFSWEDEVAHSEHPPNNVVLISGMKQHSSGKMYDAGDDVSQAIVQARMEADTKAKAEAQARLAARTQSVDGGANTNFEEHHVANSTPSRDKSQNLEINSATHDLSINANNMLDKTSGDNPLNTAEYQKLFDQKSTEGLLPKSVTGKCDTKSGMVLFTADWEAIPANSSFYSYHGMDDYTFAAREREYKLQGYTLTSQTKFKDCSDIERHQATWVKPH